MRNGLSLWRRATDTRAARSFGPALAAGEWRDFWIYGRPLEISTGDESATRAARDHAVTVANL